MPSKPKPIDVDEVLKATSVQLQSATLGRTYKDKISSLVGVAVSRTVFLYACVRIALQPPGLKAADGGPSDAFYIDEQMLDEVTKDSLGMGLPLVIPYVEEDTMVTLGKTYKDSITGLEGVAVAYTKYLASSQRVALQPTTLFEGKPIDVQYFDVSQVNEVKATVTPKAEEKKERPGGPGGMASPPKMAKR